ncbi:MAG: glycosyltransferase, partial [Candidatus Promineifilaceae bacterium]
MRIGIMLRTLGEQGGIGVYSRHLTSELLALDRQNDYVLFYRNPEHAGRFAHFPNVVERVVRAPNKLLWDQASMPLAGRRERLDVLLHPKFSVPLAAPYKTVMVLHGAGWFMPSYQRYWKPQDLAYARLMMPLYCRRAASVLSVSKLTTEIFHQRFNLPKGKIRTVYFGPGRDFRPVQEPERLQQVRQKYRLPEHFIFSLSGYDRGPRKNIEGLLATYRLLHGRVPHQLIVGGRGCERFRKDFDIPNSGYGADILFPGWIEQEDLPVFYTLA